MDNSADNANPSPHRPDYVKVGPFEFHPVVFPVSAFLILFFVIAGAIWAGGDKEAAEAVFNNVHEWVAIRFGWFFILSANIFLLLTIYLIFSRLGDVRLGGEDARPDYSYASWFAMLFSAGMGIGLIFWSVAEPMYHFGSPPRISVSPSAGAAREAMSLTFYHWGLHAWGIYAVVGASIAFFAYNRGLPLTIRSAFYPILGDKVKGPIGHVIDILAVVATLFGVATSLGLGVQQVNAGLHHLFPETIAIGTGVQILLIVGITLLATISVVSGLDRGIKLLSQTNLLLALGLLLLVFFMGPTWMLLDDIVQNIGMYLSNLIKYSFWTEAYRGEAWPNAYEGDEGNWQHWWTIFYWAWWIAWSPFVGMFIARISRGRTIREFCLGVLLVPTIVTFIWLTVFGNTAIFQQLTGKADLAGAATETALFELLATFPFSSVTSLLAIVVIVTFFVTSSDSGSLVIDTITGGGHPNPPVIQKIFWALLEGAVAATLLYAGGLKALQTASVTTGLPFAVVLLFMCFCLVKALRQEVSKGLRTARHGRRYSPDVPAEETWARHRPKT